MKITLVVDVDVDTQDEREAVETLTKYFRIKNLNSTSVNEVEMSHWTIISHTKHFEEEKHE